MRLFACRTDVVNLRILCTGGHSTWIVGSLTYVRTNQLKYTLDTKASASVECIIFSILKFNTLIKHSDYVLFCHHAWHKNNSLTIYTTKLYWLENCKSATHAQNKISGTVCSATLHCIFANQIQGVTEGNRIQAEWLQFKSNIKRKFIWRSKCDALADH